MILISRNILRILAFKNKKIKFFSGRLDLDMKSVLFLEKLKTISHRLFENFYLMMKIT